MNTELLERIADHIEAMPDSFQLATWAQAAPTDNICDTIGCVAGWAAMLSNNSLRTAVLNQERDYKPFLERKIEDTGRKALGLTDNEAHRLFMSTAWWARQMEHLGLSAKDGQLVSFYDGIELDDVGPKEAAIVLRELAAGRIDLKSPAEREQER